MAVGYDTLLIHWDDIVEGDGVRDMADRIDSLVVDGRSNWEDIPADLGVVDGLEVEDGHETVEEVVVVDDDAELDHALLFLNMVDYPCQKLLLPYHF